MVWDELVRDENEKMKELVSQAFHASTDGLQALGGKWYYMTDTPDIYLPAIHNFLMSEFVAVFGEGLMNSKTAVICNTWPHADCIGSRYSDRRYVGKLHCEKTSYWCQVTFQHAQLMAFYAFDALGGAVSVSNKIESIIGIAVRSLSAEAIALYMLYRLASSWEQCSLYERNPGYATSVKEYLADAVKKQGCAVELLCECGKGGKDAILRLAKKAAA